MCLIDLLHLNQFLNKTNAKIKIVKFAISGLVLFFEKNILNKLLNVCCICACNCTSKIPNIS